MPPPTLPPHLSYKSALVLLPPSSITKPIETLRQKHDKHYARWPAHLNLIYPFISPSALSIEEEIDEGRDAVKDDHSHVGKEVGLRRDMMGSIVTMRIRRALQGLRPFQLRLSGDLPGCFLHNKRNATVWLQPHDKDGSAEASEALMELQQRLQTEFAECNSDKRPYNPHLSFGQAGGKEAASILKRVVKTKIADFLSEEKIAGNVSKETEQTSNARAELEWLVDRVYVTTRKGYNDRFKVVGEVFLTGS